MAAVLYFMEDQRLTNISFAQLKKLSSYRKIPPSIGDVGTLNYGDEGIFDCIVVQIYNGITFY